MALPPPPPLGSQLDVAMLDNYLHSLLLTKFLQSLDPLVQILMNSGGRHDTLSQQQHHDTLRTLRIMLSSCLPALTLWMTHLQTPATKALGLQAVMIPSKNSGSQRSADGDALATKWKYIFFTALLPLCYQILQRIVVDMQQQQQQQQNEVEETFTDSQDEAQHHRRRLAQERQYQVARRMVQNIQQGIPVFKLGLLISLLFRPKSKRQSPTTLTPSLSMALSGVAFMTAAARSSSSLEDTTTTTTSPQQQQPGLYVLYAHRRWLYEESLQTFRLVFGPLLSSLRDWRQLLEEGVGRVAQVMVSRLIALSIMSRDLAVEDDRIPVEQACSLCGKHPMVIPYETDACQHIFCYTCLWSKSNSIISREPVMGHQEQTGPETLGTGYPCPTCRKLIRSSRPVPMRRYQHHQQQQQQQKHGKEQEVPTEE